MENTKTKWKSLYRAGGVAALLAVFVFRRNWSAELDVSRGFGIFAVPETPPVGAAEWFALLQAHPYVGMSLLGIYDVIEIFLVGLVFLAVCAACWETARSALLVAIGCTLAGIGAFWASNQAFGIYLLSVKSATATNEIERAALESAGEMLLALNQFGAGQHLGMILLLVAGLILSLVMLRGAVFGKATAVAGILTNVIYLLYYPVLAFGPLISIIPPVVAAPFRITWYFLIALKLFKLAKETP